MTEQASTRRRPGWWYPYIYVGAFGVVLAVNLIFMMSAVKTFSGVSTDQAYEKGLKYNERMDAQRAQKQLGWSVKAEVRPLDGGLPHSADIVLTVRDRNGLPVTGLAVDADFIRPTAEGHDKSLPFTEQGEGRYLLRLSLTLGGQWEMSARAHRGEQLYQFAQRVYLP